jgi:hypothetical protein
MPRFGRPAFAAAASGLLSLGVLAGLIVAPAAANAASTSYQCKIPAPTAQPDSCWISVPAVVKPLSLKLQIVSTPDKAPLYYQWTIGCRLDGTFSGTNDMEDSFAPVSLQLPLPVAEPDSCQISVLVRQASSNADFTATLTATTAARPQPVSHPLR